MMASLMMVKGRDTENTPLQMAVVTKEAGKTDATLDLEHAPGRTADAIVANGEMVWLTGGGLKPIQMGRFVMKESGLMTNQYVRDCFSTLYLSFIE
jgi:hypothetical protein